MIKFDKWILINTILLLKLSSILNIYKVIQ